MGIRDSGDTNELCRMIGHNSFPVRINASPTLAVITTSMTRALKSIARGTPGWPHLPGPPILNATSPRMSVVIR
jgi:hypothetical protein